MQSETSTSAKVGSYGLLAKVELKTLQSIKIAIIRNNIPNPSRSPLKRSLNSPESLKIHLSGSRGRCLFDRKDVIVNTVDIEEEQLEDKERCKSKEECTNRSPRPKKKSSKIFKEYIKGPPEGYYRQQDTESYGGKVHPSTSKEYPRSRSISPRDRRERSVEKYRKRSRERSYNDHSPPERHRRSPSYDYKSKYKRTTSQKEEKRRSRSPYEASKKRYYYRKSESPLKPGEYRPKRERSKTPRYRQEEYKRKEYRKDSRSPSPKYNRGKSPLKPGEYRPKRDRSKSPRYKQEEYKKKEYRKDSRTPSPKYNRGSSYSRSKHSRSPEGSKSRRKYSPPPSTSRKRSRTPLRPGEYRPPRRSRSPPLRPGEYRPPKRKISPEHRPDKYENEHKYPSYGIYDYADFGPMVRPPYMPRFLPREMFRPGQILVPHVQFIPVPQTIRPPMIRPRIIYNNRTIPRLVSPPRNTNSQTTSTSDNKKEEKGVETEEKRIEGEDKK